MEKRDKKIILIYVVVALFFILNISVNMNQKGFWKSIVIIGLSGIAMIVTMNINQNRTVEKKFLMIASFLGIILVFAIPILHGIDEVAHFYKTYSIFNGIDKEYGEQGELMYKIPTAINDASNIKKYEDTKTLQGRTITNTDTVSSSTYRGITLYSNIAYLTYWLPMVICQNILKMPIIGVVFIGRLFSFILWLLMSVYTIKIMPKRKEFMAFLCLMPINLTLVTTFTGDLLTNSAILLFIAYWYRLYEEKREIRKSEVAVLSVLGAISICCKIIYALVFLLLFLLPNENFRNKKHKKMVLGIILFVILIVSVMNLSMVGKDLLEAYPAIENQKEWITHHLLDYVIILVRTIIIDFPTYVYQFTTGQNTMLQCTISINSAVSILYIIILIASLYIEQININFHKWAKWLIGIIVSVIVCVIFTSLYLQWTATNYGIGYPLIMGVQGRYFFPVVALLALTNGKKKISMNRNYLWNGVILINFYVLLRIIVQF